MATTGATAALLCAREEICTTRAALGDISIWVEGGRKSEQKKARDGTKKRQRDNKLIGLGAYCELREDQVQIVRQGNI